MTKEETVKQILAVGAAMDVQHPLDPNALVSRIYSLLEKIAALEADNDALRAQCTRLAKMGEELYDNLTHTQTECDRLLEANRRARGLVAACDKPLL